MSTRKKSRSSRRAASDATAEIVSAAGRWILLPGGGFGLGRPRSFDDGRTPA